MSGGDPVSVFADGPGGFDEFGDSAALGLGAPAVQQGVGGVGVEVPGEHRAQGLLELGRPATVRHRIF